MNWVRAWYPSAAVLLVGVFAWRFGLDTRLFAFEGPNRVFSDVLLVGSLGIAIHACFLWAMSTLDGKPVMQALIDRGFHHELILIAATPLWMFALVTVAGVAGFLAAHEEIVPRRCAGIAALAFFAGGFTGLLRFTFLYVRLAKMFLRDLRGIGFEDTDKIGMPKMPRRPSLGPNSEEVSTPVVVSTEIRKINAENTAAMEIAVESMTRGGGRKRKK